MIRYPVVALQFSRFRSVRFQTGRQDWSRMEAGRSIAVTLLAVLLTTACGGQEDPDSATTSSPAESDARASNPAAAQVAPIPPPNGLQATIDVEGQSVEGRFNRLRFEARLTGDGQATASFERVAGMTLVSTISGPREGKIEWRGTMLDGFGPLTSEEVESAAHFADRIKADVLALIPLDLSCQPGADELDPAIGAALLLPWQFLLKYQPEGEIPTAEQAAVESRCQHLARPTEARDQERAPSPSIVALSAGQPFPVAAGYLPLDRDGLATLGRTVEEHDDQT